MRFVLLFVETEQYVRTLETMSPDERERAYALAGQWFADHADKLRGGSKLQPRHTATTVRLDGDEGPVVLDGPFVEGKEVVGGYSEVEADHVDDVIEMVRTWPGCPIVEIRPILEM